MKTVRRLFYVDIASSVAFVALAFLSLFFFIGFVDELGDTNKTYTALHAAAYAALGLPGNLYELMPIAVLIGTIYTLSRLAQSSEFTILRTGGLGPGRALNLLTSLGLAFAVLTFIVGDYVAPFAEQQAATLRATFKGGLNLGRTGAWLKDRQNTSQGERNYSINVGSASSGGELHDIRIFAFDANGRMLERIAAKGGEVDKQSRWTLSDVTITRWEDPSAERLPMASEEKLPTMVWNGSLSANVVSAAVLPLSTMSTVELSRYISHLADNEQAAQQYEIQFWKRALYPFACLVMVGLALPFAYLHARGGGVSLKVFGGIMLGISFVLLNNVAGHLGMLRNWTPWIVAATPSLIYLMLSMGAFAWLVRYR
ncbi:LPS export ABC transporter permease LptG [Piscinibacter terrae]|uniref:LPS export ABC transporter permease LptG n=1 Tax=Piscinibacter terrae TaxID=2496871 RepID=A0A3N7ITH4_9BURK|nr:LPS export ABC transporter permease LptG [Albitalea terrae]RQP22142.1 LPS export ABC transporter permease LptG [Albitalea terrae]